MTIIEKNKLIARFLGYTYYPFNYDGFDRPVHFVAGWKKRVDASHFTKVNQSRFLFERDARDFYLCRKHTDLAYNKSWNWLHKALELILDIDNQKGIELAAEMDKVDLPILHDTSILAPIECVYERVVDFILWWNKINNYE